MNYTEEIITLLRNQTELLNHIHEILNAWTVTLNMLTFISFAIFLVGAAILLPMTYHLYKKELELKQKELLVPLSKLGQAEAEGHKPQENDNGTDYVHNKP